MPFFPKALLKNYFQKKVFSGAKTHRAGQESAPPISALARHSTGGSASSPDRFKPTCEAAKFPNRAGQESAPPISTFARLSTGGSASSPDRSKPTCEAAKSKTIFSETFHKKGCTRKIAAFTLVEILAVVAIIVTLMSILILGNSAPSRGLTTGGNMLADMVHLARQEAITRNTKTALVVPNDKSGQNKAVTVFAYVQDSDKWEQIDQWHKLPNGVAIDPAEQDDFLKTSAILSTAAPKYEGQTITYRLGIFLPNGQIQSTDSKPPAIILNQEKDAGKLDNSDNYYKIIVNPLTGTTITRRP